MQFADITQGGGDAKVDDVWWRCWFTRGIGVRSACGVGGGPSSTLCTLNGVVPGAAGPHDALRRCQGVGAGLGNTGAVAEGGLGGGLHLAAFATHPLSQRNGSNVSHANKSLTDQNPSHAARGVDLTSRGSTRGQTDAVAGVTWRSFHAGYKTCAVVHGSPRCGLHIAM